MRFCATVAKSLNKVDSNFSVIEAAIDVCPGYLNQTAGATHFGELEDQAHGKSHACSLLPFGHRPLLVG